MTFEDAVKIITPPRSVLEGMTLNLTWEEMQMLRRALKFGIERADKAICDFADIHRRSEVGEIIPGGLLHPERLTFWQESKAEFAKLLERIG